MLPADLQRALTTAAATPRLLVSSDFDGTLAPIVSNPADARPLADAADALVSLADVPHTASALISGRALDVLRDLSGLSPAVHLVGSHGAEFTSGFTHDIDRELLDRITAELDAIAAGRPGVTVETKPASVALHVRNASADDGEAALAAAREASTGWDVQLTEGKAVLEFAVIQTDKGEALDILRSQEKASAVVFFGDDVTDEKAFRRLGGDDVGVKVGPGETLAAYRVNSPEDVAAALRFLLEARQSHSG
ncbi:trehalose-phosphatase [Mycolicibacterium celeriflavum]|uniref:Trehalose 6-phosphate phosphatase n=1 Tax=Mycolicibacterium celeriflavum TaxID=1249101 RepID=A0A1X0BSF5_MYCCF|nr:trehalose-phosphatase [Mycolicibacterium celeriflavum]MCV7237990.1 trehalose-phosphatase [Mycolicibacterium celeriflavum]OBG15808.1 trehalose-phosphatase [Mycolicibacterium celeriflavum]ORA45833.1 trehalose-phosphatase [Mycolicibacterium celeriflavum]BBY45472.1 trehalose 6-phosphate phosphatase [Mycolicibacterium celeriflavum]